MGSKNLQNKEEAVPGIRNDDIGENGVGMSAAGTPDTHDCHFLPDNRAVLKSPDLSPVIGMDMAVPF